MKVRLRWVLGIFALSSLLAPEARAQSVAWIEGLPPVALAQKFALAKPRHATVEPCPGLAATIWVVTGEKRDGPFAAVIVDGSGGIRYMTLPGEFARGRQRRATVTVELSEAPAQEVTLELRRESNASLRYAWGRPTRIGALTLGEVFPQLEAKQVEGGSWESTELRGRVTVINWWSTWCIPCVEEIPALNGLVDELRGDPGVAFVAISPETRRDLQKFLADRPFTFTQLADPDATEVFGHRYPRHVVVAADGVVVFDQIGWSDGIATRLRAAVSAARAGAGAEVDR